MKKIWICGSTGMLGSHFTRTLQNCSENFVGTSKSELDITHLEKVIDFVKREKITHIINCAAYTQVDLAEDQPLKAYEVNSIGPYNLGLAAKEVNAWVIHFSTDYVFNGKKDCYSEEDTCSPLNTYGLSKLAGEIKLLNVHSNVCIMRTSWLFGHPGKNFVLTMIQLMKEKERLNIVDDQVGRPTYCQDLAEASMKLLNAKGVYHFANSSPTSWFKFAETIQKAARELSFSLNLKTLHPIPSHEYPTKARRPSHSILNTQKIEAFGITPRPWQNALYDYLKEIKHEQSQR